MEKRYSFRVRADSTSCYEEILSSDNLINLKLYAKRYVELKNKKSVGGLYYIFDKKKDNYININ